MWLYQLKKSVYNTCNTQNVLTWQYWHYWWQKLVVLVFNQLFNHIITSLGENKVSASCQYHRPHLPFMSTSDNMILNCKFTKVVMDLHILKWARLLHMNVSCSAFKSSVNRLTQAGFTLQLLESQKLEVIVIVIWRSHELQTVDILGRCQYEYVELHKCETKCWQWHLYIDGG